MTAPVCVRTAETKAVVTGSGLYLEHVPDPAGMWCLGCGQYIAVETSGVAA